MANLREIAAASGVSIRTVNRVLKSDGYVGAHTRTRVEAAVQRLGYRPNLAARALKTSRSHIVGVLTFSTDELRMAQVAAMEQRLREADYHVNVTFLAESARPADARHALDEMIEQAPAALVVLGHEPEVTRDILPKLVPALARSGLPYVLLDPKGLDAQWTKFDAVMIDRACGVHEAVLHLARRGAQRIAFLGTQEERTRLDGYERALRELGRKPVLLDYPGADAEALRELGRKFSRQKSRADAVLAHSDQIALAFMAGLHDAGVRVPQDVAVVGFDDRPAAKLAWPALTTIAQPSEEAGRAAAEILLHKIAGEARPADGWSRSFPTRLVLRETA